MDKKKIVALMLATSAGTGATLMHNTVAHADEYKASGHVVNVTSVLRVRAKSSTSSEVLGYLRNGDKVNIKGKSGDWYKIDFEGKTAYVYNEYIKEGSNNSSSEKVKGKGKVVNVESSLRIRSGASTSHSVIGYLYEGNTFDIIEKSGDWYKIKHNGRIGYVYGEYVKPAGESSSTNNNVDNDLGGKVGQVINVTSSLRIRSGAGTNHSVVGYLSNGEKFDITGRSGDWYKIKTNRHSGYVHKDYVRILGQGSNSSSSSSDDNNEVQEKGKGKVVNITSNLRIRNAPSTNSSVVGYLLEGQTFDILGKSGDWYKIKHNGSTGYVHEDYVSVIGQGNSNNSGNNSSSSSGQSVSEYGKVVNVSTSLRLRKGPSTNSSVVGYLFPGETFKITERNGSWYKVNANGKVGYASSDYIKLINKNEANSSGSSSTSSASYESVYNILKAQIGSPYIWGGSGEFITHDSLRMFKKMFPGEAAAGKYNIPSKYINNGYRAFDCSGLLYWGFRQVGINIGRTTYDQINAGREVSLNDVRPGDLLFYRSLGHVGMYIGNGKWLEAPHSHDYVKIANVPWSQIGRARRILK